jgi:hypothetical protein
MAVYRLFKNKAFEPEAIATMTDAYADVCRALGLRDGDHPQTNVVAKRKLSCSGHATTPLAGGATETQLRRRAA